MKHKSYKKKVLFINKKLNFQKFNQKKQNNNIKNQKDNKNQWCKHYKANKEK